jgi:MutS domain III
MASSARAVVILGKETAGKVIVWVAQKGDNAAANVAPPLELSYYQYHDEGSFHHTICLLDSIPNLTIVHTATLQTPKKKEGERLAKLNEALQQALVDKDDGPADEEQRPAESLVQSHGSVAPVSVQTIQPMVKNILASESAYLHFCGNVDFQHEPTLCAGLKLCLEQQQAGDNMMISSIGPGTLMQSFLQLDATAADALLLWPPANAAQQFITGGHLATNSIYGLLAHSCCTSSGTGLLKKWLRQPLVDVVEIAARHDSVEYWLEHSVTRDALRLEGLKRIGTTDLRKLASTLSTPTALSTRRALMALYDLYLVAWQKLPGVVEQMATAENMPALSLDHHTTLVTALANLQPAIQLVEAVLDMDQAPREYLVQADYKEELQDVHTEIKNVQGDIQACFTAMNEEWAKLSGSSATNLVRLEETTDGGLQFRLADTNSSKILQQTAHITVHRLLKNGVYFSTTELTELCSHRQDLRNEYDRLQTEVVADAITVAATFAVVLERAAGALAALDVLTALAHTAAHRQYCRPVLLDRADQPVLELVGARHPCVELQEHVEFIPNDCTLGANGAFLLVTGPNSMYLCFVDDCYIQASRSHTSTSLFLQWVESRPIYAHWAPLCYWPKLDHSYLAPVQNSTYASTLSCCCGCIPPKLTPYYLKIYI